MSIETWIATRVLKGVGDGERVEVGIGRPEMVAEGEWRCAFRISYEGQDNLQHGHGVDAIQALVQALEGIRVALSTSGVEATWEGGEPGDPGFPRQVPQFYGSAFSRKIEAIIDAEIVNFAEAAAKKRPSDG